MANPELQTAPKKVWEDHERAATLTRRMRPLTKEREWKVVRLFASQKREYNDLLNHLVETRQREELIQEARAAAQRAIRESGPEPQTAFSSASFRSSQGFSIAKSSNITCNPHVLKRWSPLCTARSLALPAPERPLSEKEQATRTAELTARLDELERVEEALIERAQAESYDAARRADCSPSCVLGVTVIAAKARARAA